MIRFVRRTFRFSEEEDANYHKAAERAGLNFSDWVREALTARVSSRGPGLRKTVTSGPGPRPARPRDHATGCICKRCTAATVATVSADNKED